MKDKHIFNFSANFPLNAKKCYIFGCGLSVKDFVFDRITPEDYIIAVNRAFFMFKDRRLNLLLWQDLNFWRAHGLQLRRLSATLFCYSTAAPAHPKYRKFNINKNIPPGWKNKLTLFSGTLTSGARAVQFAHALGFKDVTTVGMLANDEPEEFFGKNKYHSPHTIPAFQKDRLFIQTFPGKLEEC